MGSKEIIMFSPEYWWEEDKGKTLRGKKEEIERWGGLGRVVANVSERLPKYGYHVSVLARKKGGIYPEKDYDKRNIIHYKPVDGVDVWGIPACTNLGIRIQPHCESLYRNLGLDGIISWDHIFTTLNYILDYNEGRLKDILYDEDTIVHAHDWFGAQFIYNLKTSRKLPDSKTVLSIHMSSQRTKEIVEKNEIFQWELKGCKLADKVHAVSKYQAELLRKNYGIRSDKIIYIPNGIDIYYFRPPLDEKEVSEDENILRKYGIKPNGYILFYGRIDPNKGIYQLLQAYEKLAPKLELDLAIFGLPSNLEYYLFIQQERENLPPNLKEKVKIYVEKLPTDILPRVIRSASLAVFPSLEEAFGLVAVEAQACGIPVVVGNVGGLPENVRDKKTGVIVNSHNPTSIAEGIEYVIANREDLASGTREFAESYSWDKIIERYVNELYNS